MRQFYIYLTLIYIPIMGTALTDFALGIWILDINQTSKSIKIFTMIWFCQIAPSAFFGPIIGSYIDRYDKKKIIIIGLIISGLCCSILMLLYHHNSLGVLSIYSLVSCTGLANAFIYRAFYVSIPVLVKLRLLIKAHGVLGIFTSINQMVIPILAPVMYKVIGIDMVFIITLLISSITLLIFSTNGFINVPKSKKVSSILDDVRYVLKYTFKNYDYLIMLLFFSVLTFFIGLVEILFTPLILDFSNEYFLGISLFCGGIGGFLGGLLTSRRRKISRPLSTSVNAAIGIALLLIVSLIKVNIYILSFGAFMIFFLFAIISVLRNIFIQTIIPVESLGRVSSLWSSFITIAFPLSFLIAGLITEYILSYSKDLLQIFEEYYPGSDLTTSIILIMALSGFILLILTLYYRFGKKFEHLDKVFASSTFLEI